MDHRLTWALSDLFCYLMVFARLGGFVYFMPGIAEIYVTQRIRLLFALTLAFIITPVVQIHFPSMPQAPFQFLFILTGEAVIGMIAGIILKILMSTLELVGALYGYQMGLANAFAFSPATSQQTGLAGAFLASTVLTLIFSLDFHQVFLRAIVESYSAFSPLNPLSFFDLTSDLVQMSVRAITASFSLALRLSGPMIVFGFIFMMASGLAARLVPQLQVFFVLQPFQIFAGFALLITTLVLMVRHFFKFFDQVIANLWET